MATSIIKYYKNSNTGQLICEQTIISDIITHIPKFYYDIYSRYLGEYFDLTGFVIIKQKKWNLYRNRWLKTKINDIYFHNFNIHKNKQEIRKDKLIKINKLYSHGKQKISQ